MELNQMLELSDKGLKAAIIKCFNNKFQVPLKQREKIESLNNETDIITKSLREELMVNLI